MKHLLAVLLIVGASGFLMAGACDEIAEACGPCGKVSTGDATISGDAALDGFFKAVGDLDGSFGKINGEFEGQVRDLALAFEVEDIAELSFDALVDATVAKIQADLNASIEGGISGGLTIDYVPPKCEVNVSASFDAQASCEAKAGCDVDAECSGGEVSFTCEGSCSGSCSGNCSFRTCTVDLGADLACSGSCSGSCSAEVSGKCEGTCKGECDGTCSAYVENTEGEMECNGSCSGECSGECAVKVEGECSGKCEGECKVEATAEVECSGETKCEGSCDAECSGGCDGEIKQPSCSASAECEASADCEAQASASASANASCTPPSLELKYSLSATLEADAAAKAKFMGKIEAFKVNMIGMLKGMANLKILFDADAAAEINIEPPTVTLLASIEGLVSTATSGEFNIAAGLIPCVVPALQESVTIMTGLPAKMGATVSAQAKFVAIIM
jgi:hypothetical protein